MKVMFVKLPPAPGNVKRANWPTELALLCGEPKFGGSSPRGVCSPVSARSKPPPSGSGAWYPSDDCSAVYEPASTYPSNPGGPVPALVDILNTDPKRIPY